MRIGFFTDSYLPQIDGATISINNLRHGLENLGHEVFIICPARPGDSENLKDPHVLPIFSFPSPWYEGYRDSLPLFRTYLKQIEDMKLDIIHVHTQLQIGLFGLFIKQKLDLPLVSTIHADLSLTKDYRKLLPAATFLALISGHIGKTSSFLNTINKTKPGKNWSSRVVSQFAKNYFESCDLIIAPSQKAFNQLKDQGVKQPIKIIANGLLTESIVKASKNKSRSSIRKSLKIPANACVIISTSRLVKEKRIDLLLEVFVKLIAKNSEKSLHLLVVGDGSYRNHLVSHSKSLGISKNVTFTGRVEQPKVWEYLGISDIFTNLSDREIQPLSVAEAVTVGLPVVIIDQDTAPTVVPNLNGFIVEDDKEALQKLNKLVNSRELRIKFSKESKELAKQTSQENVSRELESLYKSLIKTTY